MQPQEITYHGRKIVTDRNVDPPQVTIDGENIPLLYVKELDHYVAIQHYSFVSYASLEALAQAVVDHVINQR